jgi:predicted lipid carrier protein YhbT
MPEYLTPEWVEEFQRLGAELPERTGATARIQYVIVRADPVKYYVVFKDGRVVASALGELNDPEVVLRIPYEDSVAIQRGDLDPNLAFSDGSIEFEGDMRALMSLLPVLWPSPTRRLGSAARYRTFQQEVRAMTSY